MPKVETAVKPQRGSTLLARWIGGSVLVVAAVCVAIAAHAQGFHGPQMGGSPDGGGMMMFGGPPQRIARTVDHMLDGLNATDAQRAQIKQIALAAAADLKSQRDAGKGMRDKGMQIFAAPTVDAGAAEALRQQMMSQRDQASKRTLQAMLDIARVLTPEQRAKIGARISERQAVMKERMQRMDQEREQHMPRVPPQK